MRVTTDITGAIINCPPPIQVTSGPGVGLSATTVNWSEPLTYIENSGAEVNITCSHSSGQVFSPGLTTVKCEATPDPSGNIGKCSFDVTVFCTYFKDIPESTTCQSKVRIKNVEDIK